MHISMRIDKTTLGGGYDAHSSCRSGSECNHVIQLTHYCVMSFSGSKEIGGAERMKQRTKASFVLSKQLTQSTTT